MSGFFETNNNPKIGNGPPAVLVVDDSSTVRSVVSLQLNNLGCQVYQAGDGIEAQEVLKEVRIHLAFIDLHMPRMDGHQLMTYIRDAYPLIRMVAITASTSMTDAMDTLSAGAMGFVRKPVKAEDLKRYLHLSCWEVNLWLQQLQQLGADARAAKGHA
jgi:CheY-like chemotaxis protein